MKLRGYIALLLILSTLTVSDLIQRLLIGPIVRLSPSRRIPVLTRWQKLMASVVLEPLRVIGGAKFGTLPQVTAGAGVLVLMNHQSLLDIPLVVRMLQGSYPRIVTRQRYASWIPLISHMTRLYQYPVVQAGTTPGESRKMLRELEVAAAVADVPLVIFPEGSRSRDGTIGRFRAAGLRAILSARAWTVWVVVADGFWQRAMLSEFFDSVATIDGRVTVRGPFAWDDPEVDPTDFIDSMRDRMIEALDALRTEHAA